jgi:hypothetical protein
LATEANDCVAGFGLPIAAAKTGGGNDVPLKRLEVIFGDFEVAAEFEGHHSVIGFLIEKLQLAAGVSAATGATNTSRNLFPVSHFLDAL